MKLNELKKGQLATVSEINANRELKNRFNSFGLVKGAIISIDGHSLAKKTMEICINKTHIALRASEAEKIEVTV
ncbi:MAG: ferrous iron transport protein A [Gammaproteobacteria bacterium]|nr:ferrous iron transport protein A [Gammaproteobacteria bacterium]